MVDLLHVVEIPEYERVEILDLGIALDCKREDVLNRFDGRIGGAFQKRHLVFVKAIPLFVVAHFEQLRAVLLDDFQGVGLVGFEEMSAVDQEGVKSFVDSPGSSHGRPGRQTVFHRRQDMVRCSNKKTSTHNKRLDLFPPVIGGRAFLFIPHGARILVMGKNERLTPALKKAREEGIDLSQLYERLSWTPTERIKRNFRAALVFEGLRRAGQKHRDRKRR